MPGVLDRPGRAAAHPVHHRADGDDHDAARGQLLDQVAGDLRRLRRDEDPVVRSLVGQAEDAGHRLTDLGPGQIQPRQGRGGPSGEIGDPLHAEHPAGRADQTGQDRGGPARTGPHIEHPHAGADLQQLEHRHHGGRLGVRLAMPDRQRQVDVRVRLRTLGKERGAAEFPHHPHDVGDRCRLAHEIRSGSLPGVAPGPHDQRTGDCRGRTTAGRPITTCLP
ncbi:hypothetical protein SDC9_136744 [bioreactor metagenome]|uniref:Uncharacterized protein n=1 Tax=bioreactor metagenome TaxID=1076179 RepID=A0A645DM52_9ZZZZ